MKTRLTKTSTEKRPKLDGEKEPALVGYVDVSFRHVWLPRQPRAKQAGQRQSNGQTDEKVDDGMSLGETLASDNDDNNNNSECSSSKKYKEAKEIFFVPR
ncbi:hypothetical protein RUM43_010976 [Polyplax serrata]|uniref:Uncharacterized protein n=1 Tax=Polyplax serrata TaxID=468196 RepID=A0AAN8NST0_POLSC